MDFRTAIIIAIGVFLFTSYYLEKEMEREKIFRLFSGLSLIWGAASAYAVATRHPSFDAFITLTVIFIFMAILYFEEATQGEARPEVQPQSSGGGASKARTRSAKKK